MTKEQIWEKIEDYEIATYDELVLVTDVVGYTEETLNLVIYARTGYRDIDQYMEEM